MVDLAHVRMDKALGSVLVLLHESPIGLRQRQELDEARRWSGRATIAS